MTFQTMKDQLIQSLLLIIIGRGLVSDPGLLLVVIALFNAVVTHS